MKSFKIPLLLSVFFLSFFYANSVLPASGQSDPSSRTIKLLFTGDLMLDRFVKDKIDTKGIDYILGNAAKTGLFAGYDLVGANLEGAVTNKGKHYSPINKYDFAFRPQDVASLKKYNFNFFNIANNHILDQGTKGYNETSENLKRLGYVFSGCSDGKIGNCSFVIKEVKGKKIGLVGFSQVYKKINEKDAQKIISGLADKTDLIIVNIHWGQEYAAKFNSGQSSLSHALIDAGADIIIGHHPHVIQGVEIYKNKPIFYSLGNFIFDQYFSADTQSGLALSIALSDAQIELNIIPVNSSSRLSLLTPSEKNKIFKKISSVSRIGKTGEKQLLNGVLNLSLK
jgi:gamma-polyglutamate biosynthesis protein CapA